MLNYSAKKKFFAYNKLPSKMQWRRFLSVLTKREKVYFFSLLIIFLGNLIFLSANFYFNNTELKPAEGGIFTEGIVGQPGFINPIYSSSNDADRDLTELLFSGIVKYDENGKLVYDLAKDIKIENDGKTYRVLLKDNIFWSDTSSKNPQKFTASDIIFTIQTIQNQDYKSSLRVNWLGVEVEKINDFELTFKLKNTYSSFMENLTVKILPSHIWQKLSVQNFSLSEYNLKPVGSGPYMIDSISKDGSGHINYLILKINPNYYGQKPHLEEIRFKFFDEEKSLIASVNNGEINGFSLSSMENKKLVNDSLFQPYNFYLPRYFAVFFNQEESKALSDLKVRQGLNYATDKNDLIRNVLNSEAKIVDSPILPDIYGFAAATGTYSFDIEKAKALLADAGFTTTTENGTLAKIVKKQPAFQFKSELKMGSSGTEVQELQKCLAKYPDIYPSGEITGSFGSKTKEAVIKFQEKYASEILKPSGLTKGTGTVLSATRKKLNTLCAMPTEEIIPLKISLVTVNQPMLIKTANILKAQWWAIGADIQITTSTSSDLENNIIKPRDYEALLFGEALGNTPDPFPFWDSIQKKDPGLNLAVYGNKDADKLLEESRQTLDTEERKKKLEKFQNILIADAPCVFLYNPDYVYFVSAQIKGIKEKNITDPSKRFTNVENWYIKQTRVWIQK
jgi:ABC-type transport system substrate-binding protein